MKSTGERILAVLTATAVLCGFVAVGASVAAGVTGANVDPDTGLRVDGCVIRFTPTGPQIYENASHDCQGVTGVAVAPTGELVVYREAPASPIVTVLVSPDETLSGSRGIIAGASGGGGTTAVRFYSTKLGRPVKVTEPVMVCTVCNVWIGWVSA